MAGHGDDRATRPGAYARCLALALVLASASVPVRADAAPDPERGRLLAEAGRCPECHGREGGSEAADGAANTAPRLDGQRLDYMIKEFHDFREGRRHSDAMDIIARDDDAEVLDILRYYAGAQWRTPAPALAAGPRAPRLYEEGDAARAIAACAECHGAGAEGSAGRRSPVPRLAGQDPGYLQRQLRDWRAGARRNSVENVMNRETAALTDAEIDELAQYLSRL